MVGVGVTDFFWAWVGFLVWPGLRLSSADDGDGDLLLDDVLPSIDRHVIGGGDIRAYLPLADLVDMVPVEGDVVAALVTAIDFPEYGGALAGLDVHVVGGEHDLHIAGLLGGMFFGRLVLRGEAFGRPFFGREALRRPFFGREILLRSAVGCGDQRDGKVAARSHERQGGDRGQDQIVFLHGITLLLLCDGYVWIALASSGEESRVAIGGASNAELNWDVYDWISGCFLLSFSS
jgi:hypothetical protein